MDAQAWGHRDTAARLRQRCLELVRQQNPLMERSFPPLGDPCGVGDLLQAEHKGFGSQGSSFGTGQGSLAPSQSNG